jgi:hypothetical protein
LRTAASIILKQNLNSGCLKIDGGEFPRATVCLDVEGNLLALNEAAQSGALDRAHMNEDVLAAAVRRDKPIAFLFIEEFDSSNLHLMPFRGAYRRPRDATGFQSNLAEVAETCAGRPDEAIQRSVQKRSLYM